MIAASWEIEVSEAAAADIRGIVRWTRRRFGPDQATKYGRVIKEALKELSEGPDILGTKDCAEAGPRYRTLHIARHGRRGRHFILFRARSSERRLIVVRIIHESMDLMRHLSPDEED